jgi:4'-phosphopantetheinyl transferase
MHKLPSRHFVSAESPRIVLALKRLDDVLSIVPQSSLDWLSQSELQRYGSFSSGTRRQQFLCGRYLARVAIGYIPRRPWNTFYLSAPEDGPPRITGQSGSDVIEPTSISISHTDGWVACVVCERSVGVDVQSRTKLRDITALSLVIGCDFVGEAGSSDQECTLSFYANWGLREAWIKQSSQDSETSIPRFIPSVDTQDVLVGLVSDLGDATLALYPVGGSLELAPGSVQVTDWARWRPLEY